MKPSNVMEVVLLKELALPLSIFQFIERFGFPYFSIQSHCLSEVKIITPMNQWADYLERAMKAMSPTPLEEIALPRNDPLVLQACQQWAHRAEERGDQDVKGKSWPVCFKNHTKI